MVTKPCPKCQEHSPVACKACPCGYVFFSRRAISINKVARCEEGEVKRRRTERTKRERPDYFNSLQFENQLGRTIRNRQRTENSTSSGTNDIEGEGSNSEEGCTTSATNAPSSGSTPKKRGRPKKNFTRIVKEESKTMDKEEDMFANIPKEKEFQFSIVLAEINRKMCWQNFHP